MHHLKAFARRDDKGFCRHTDDIDFCGQVRTQPDLFAKLITVKQKPTDEIGILPLNLIKFLPPHAQPTKP